MAKPMSRPERRFASLVSRHGISELTANDGTDNPKKYLHLSDDGRGTTLIKGGALLRDYPLASGKMPKNYEWIQHSVDRERNRGGRPSSAVVDDERVATNAAFRP